MRLIPRRPRAALLVASVALLVAACGGGEQDAEGPAGTDPTSGAFPMEIEHVFGSTTVEQRPERVVALGVTDADAVLALGTVPVANTGYPFFPGGLGPWAQPLVEGEDVVLLSSDSEPNLEQIAGLDPDLIVGISAGFEEPVYQQLSQIAPVVARPVGTAAYTASRDDATRSIARALGEPERGEELIQAARTAFTDALRDNPGFQGRTASVLLPYDGQYGAYLPGDARGRVLTELGFALPEALAARDTGDSFFVPLSQEELGLADGDALVVLVDDGTRAQLDADPVLAQLPVVTGGGLVVPDIDLRGAMTYNTVLSAPFAVDGLVPLLSEALDAEP